MRFSALWSGQWRGVGTASTSPYSVSWDMCTSGVPDGDVELGMEVWDNANNKWVYSEHYTNIHINKSYDFFTPDAKGCFFRAAPIRSMRIMTTG